MVLPFLFLFLLTALPRVLAPFELEWNEGHSAEQAWRFAMGLPLYPPADSGWVPYMYAPLYHVAHGWIMALTGSWSLAWGRLISLLATFLTVQAIYLIVYNHTRQASAAAVAAMMYFAYYKPSGFWYDIVRVDSFAFALAIWGMYFTLRRKPREWHAVAGLVLLALATWAKQTNGVIAVVCAAWIVFQRPRATILTCFAIAFVSANAVFFFLRGGSDLFFKYVYTNAVNHPSMPNVWYPGYTHPNNFRQIAGAEGWLVAYLRLWRDAAPPQIWTECLRHAAIPIGFILAWPALAMVRRSRPRGLFLALPCVALAYLGLESFAKFGGYINNFMPVYLGVAILFGLSLPGLARLHRGVWWRSGVHTLAAVGLVLQILQPWKIPSPGDASANWSIIQRDPNPARLQQLKEWTGFLNDRERAAGEGWEFVREEPAIHSSVKWRHFLGRVSHAGLLWFPSHHRPAPGSEAAYRRLLDWLAERNRTGESVLIIHHQWYGILTGHPLTYNIDMLRCAHWAGDPIPRQFLMDIQSRRWDHLILATRRAEWDWLAANVGDVIKTHYEFTGLFEPLAEEENTRALMPVTGADIRPMAHWRPRLEHRLEEPPLPPIGELNLP